MATLSPSIQDYLKIIYRLAQEGTQPTTNDVARAMRVSAASVTNMLKRLAEMKLVTYTSYKGVQLTESGISIALEMLRHHRLIETYLAQALGYSLDQLHDEAEHLEHHISEQFEDRIAELLGHPQYDPHGDPIPSKEGVVPPVFNQSLAEVAAGSHVIIRRISDQNTELLRYLMDCQLIPQAAFQLLAKAPFDGPLTLQKGDHQIIIGHKVAQHIFVEYQCHADP